MAPVRIELLGGLTVRSEGRVTRHFETRKAAELLAFLALSPGKSFPRDFLMELLWPDEDPDATRVRLRQALSALRRSLDGAPFLIADRLNVHLDASLIATDIAELERLRRAAKDEDDPGTREILLQKAADLCTGDILPDIHELWASSERERISEAFRELLTELSSLLTSRGSFSQAIEMGRKAIRQDPLSEEAHTHLMRVFSMSGRPAEALRQYHELERVLKSELDTVPSADTRRLLDEIRQGRHGSHKDAHGEPLHAASTPASPPLPQMLSRFFGREVEIRQICDTLDPSHDAAQCRLMTITGVGGTGKTSLALEAGHRLAYKYNGRAWFVPLADVDEPDLVLDTVLDAVLNALAIPRSSQRDARGQIEALLATGPALFILDNFEQLADTAAGVVVSLLERNPALSCLVTSRQRLHVRGERELSLPPLAVPERRAETDDLLASPAVQLFVDRVQAIRPRFALTRENGEAVGDVCRMLDGLPLALDLVAGWAATLTPQQMRQRLSGGDGSSLDFLVSRSRETEERHRSLRAALEGSMEQLPRDLQRFFARLSVFRGGFTLESAEQVAGAGVNDVLDAVSELQSRSLIVEDDERSDPDSIRFRTLVTVRAFALERLGDETAAMEEAHARHFLGMALAAKSAVLASDHETIAKIDSEQENFRAAFGWARRHDMETALTAADALSRVWQLRGQSREWRAWLISALEDAKQFSDRARAAGVHALAILSYAQSDFKTARDLLEQTLHIQRAVDDREEVLRTLKDASLVVRQMLDYRAARRYVEEALQIAQPSGHDNAWLMLRYELGLILKGLLEYDESERILLECLDQFRARGMKQRAAHALSALASVHWGRGDDTRAQPLVEESYRIAQEVGDLWLQGAGQHSLGTLAIRRSDLSAARMYLAECVRTFRQLDNRVALIYSVEAFGYAAMTEGDAVTAARLLGAGKARRAETGAALSPDELAEFTQACGRAQESLGEEAFEREFEAGSRSSIEEALRLALGEVD